VKTVTLNKGHFYADHFWSLKDQRTVREDVFVKKYLSNYFTLKDIYRLDQMVGRQALLAYAKEVGNHDRIKHLLELIDRY